MGHLQKRSTCQKFTMRHIRFAFDFISLMGPVDFAHGASGLPFHFLVFFFSLLRSMGLPCSLRLRLRSRLASGPSSVSGFASDSVLLGQDFRLRLNFFSS